MIFRVALVLALSASVSAEFLRINAGGPEIRSIGWRRDISKFHSGASSHYESANQVSAPGTWKPVYKTHRYSTRGDLEYKIPLNAGTYNVYLLFSEVYFKTAGARRFSVKVDGRVVYASLDVFQRAGGAFKPLYVPVTGLDGPKRLLTVTLGRIPGKNNPMLSGLVVEGFNVTGFVKGEGSVGRSSPTPSPSASPLRLCITGRKENEFSMNVGGSRLLNGDFGGENMDYIVGDVGKANGRGGFDIPGGYRYAVGQSLTFKIPVPSGTYTVSTFFMEFDFHTPGKRVFNIVINGKTVLSKLDVVVASGGLGRHLCTNSANCLGSWFHYYCIHQGCRESFRECTQDQRPRC